MRGNNLRNRIMIVDDDMFVRKVIRAVIADLADVDEVADGADVVETYKRVMPDLVFLDVHLPHKMGTDILREIKEIDQDAHIVMVSADSCPTNVLASKELGIHGFLTKPFPRDRIIKHLHECPTILFTDR